VQQYLSDVKEDVLDHAEYFQQPKEGERPMLFGIPFPQPDPGESLLHRYQVNVLIGHSGVSGAPVVYEDNPTHDNLVGHIEHIAQMGTLVTDFTHIKAGAFHRANGGYLLLDALKVLSQPFAWEALKRALRSREIRTESLGQALSLISTVSLEPEPIPLDLKVVLVGGRLILPLACLRSGVRRILQGAGGFREDMHHAAEAISLRADRDARLGASCRPLDRSAVARVSVPSRRRRQKLTIHRGRGR
jgi:predicted ATP-dependent protease